MWLVSAVLAWLAQGPGFYPQYSVNVCSGYTRRRSSRSSRATSEVLGQPGTQDAPLSSVLLLRGAVLDGKIRKRRRGQGSAQPFTKSSNGICSATWEGGHQPGPQIEKMRLSGRKRTVTQHATLSSCPLQMAKSRGIENQVRLPCATQTCACLYTAGSWAAQSSGHATVWESTPPLKMDNESQV